MFSSLLGEFECKLDAKGRLRLPSQLIKQLAQFQSDNLVIHRGYDNHLTLYPETVWEEKKRRALSQFNPDRKDERSAIRYFYRGATGLTIDSSDRVLLPKKLTDWAGIEKDVVLFAYEGQIEVWDQKAYDEDVINEPASYGELTESIHQAKQKNNEQ